MIWKICSMLFTNYLRSAWRGGIRNKKISLIHLAGLSIGIACVLLIALYVRDEFRFDNQFAKSNRIYQLYMDVNFGGQAYKAYYTPPPVGDAFRSAFPEVKAFTRTYGINSVIASAQDAAGEWKYFTEKRIYGVDSNYLEVFDYPLLEGDPQTCLRDPHSIVLTEAAAVKYFGSVDAAMGKHINLDGFRGPFAVTGVLKNVPDQSSFQFDMLFSMADCASVKRFSWSWVWCQMSTYVVLDEQTAGSPHSVASLEAKFPALVRERAPGAFARIGLPFDDFIRKGGKWDFHLQPMTRVHLYSSGIESFYTNAGDIGYVYLFLVIAVFVILLACVNFMNLSTARATQRAREVGVRKVLGSSKLALIYQFLAEALGFSGVSTLLALLLVSIALPFFNEVSGKQLTFGDLWNWELVSLIVGLPLAIGFLAGIYPALYMTSFRAVSVLKGERLFRKGSNVFTLRNGLVVFQFAVSIALIICSVVVYQQIQYERHRDMGLEKDHVLVLHQAEKMPYGAREAMRQSILETPAVRKASITTAVPGADYNDFTDFYVPGTESANGQASKNVTLSSFVVDEDFVPTLKLELVEGRNFSKNFADSASVILNETAVRQAGWKHPIGQRLLYPGGDSVVFKVIGVVKDFNVRSVRSVVSPFALFPASSQTHSTNTSYLLISYKGDDPQALITACAREWRRFAPEVPFNYSFLGKDFEAMYLSDARLGQVFGIFTFLSILIACLGLLGLSIYTTERRTREIGIRKVLGASPEGLVFLLTRDFVALIFVAAWVAFPAAWWFMHRWLDGFAYRISLTWWVFGISALAALVIGLGTTGYQSLRAAGRNPVESLRTE